MQAKSKQIRDLLGMYPMDPDWSTPSMIDKNPLIWMLEANGLIIDVRHAPREIQEAAFGQGLIPYIPQERSVLFIAPAFSHLPFASATSSRTVCALPPEPAPLIRPRTR